LSDDAPILQVAFGRAQDLENAYEDAVPWAEIHKGITFAGESILLANQVQGIFKPKQMARGPISIKTTIPKGDAVNIYNDQLTDEGYYQYSLEAGDPHGERNVLLWQALEDHAPFIYFHAVAPAVYKILYPCFVNRILVAEGYAVITIGKTIFREANFIEYQVPDEIESRYIVRETKLRLHQASFREAVLNAYHRRCAVTGLPVPKLLEAAHIIPDSLIGDKQTVSNGISLNRLHHKAYDANLIGIDPDYKIHVSKELIIENGGPLLQHGILEFDGRSLTVPRNKNQRPNRDYLARRYEQYEIRNR
jgi:putative restriction endonuclease